ncbi:MAG: 3-phenylpropionate/trans-cinnamate dioxygenase ferredoxin reductase subunit [Gammaproteobacteria bacterium]|jgi:3-phenylpropionate/trans-cinnamate dioxygenase ferredoxin reductase subunit
MTKRIVIVGAGQAGGQAVDTLLRADQEHSITLIGDESHPPYQRPPLSKKLLAGEMEVERTYLKPLQHYQDKGVTLHLGREAATIDLDAHSLSLDDGTDIAYDGLLLATGSRARLLDLPGAALSGIYALRNLHDAQAIREDLHPQGHLVVIGGGFVGLEVAAVAISKGMTVTVLEAGPALLGRVMPPAMSSWFEALHRSHGVEVRVNARVEGFQGEGRVSAVCVDGEQLPASLVVIGIGIVPNQEIAERSGLVCDNGIIVDTHCRTSHPDVYAAGDCTRHPQPILGGTLRLESVHNAMSQGKIAASNLLGTATEYAEVPWFWSDQYATKLQMVGLSQADDDAIVRGDMNGDQFSVLYLRDGRLVAADVVNNPREFMACRKLVPLLGEFDRAHLADPEQPLQDLL